MRRKAAPGTPRRFAAVPNFGSDRGEADMPRPPAGFRSVAYNPKQTSRSVTQAWRGAFHRGASRRYRGLQASRIRAKTLTAMPTMQHTITTQVAVLPLTSEQAPKSTEM